MSKREAELRALKEIDARQTKALGELSERATAAKKDLDFHRQSSARRQKTKEILDSILPPSERNADKLGVMKLINSSLDKFRATQLKRAEDQYIREMEEIERERVSVRGTTSKALSAIGAQISSEIEQEQSRRQKISEKKRGAKRPNRFPIAYAKAKEIHQRSPRMTVAAVLLKLERDLPGVDMPTERQLRRFLTGH
jgi:hypothetical protein